MLENFDEGITGKLSPLVRGENLGRDMAAQGLLSQDESWNPRNVCLLTKYGNSKKTGARY
jgi:hypothetical protein